MAVLSLSDLAKSLPNVKSLFPEITFLKSVRGNCLTSQFPKAVNKLVKTEVNQTA